MLNLYASAVCLSQVGVAFMVQPPTTVHLRNVIPRSVASLVSHGTAKMLSEFTLLANMRALVVLPPILIGALQSDRVSISLAIADAVASLFMVIVNRNFVLYCQHEVKRRAVAFAVVFIVACMAVLGATTVAMSRLLPSLWPKQVWAADLLCTFLFFGALTAYQDVRYYFWARGTGVRGSIYVHLLALIAQTGVVLLLPPAYWLPTMATTLTVVVLTVVAILFGAPDQLPERS
jgi:hypothetical protein